MAWDEDDEAIEARARPRYLRPRDDDLPLHPGLLATRSARRTDESDFDGRLDSTLEERETVGATSKGVGGAAALRRLESDDEVEPCAWPRAASSAPTGVGQLR